MSKIDKKLGQEVNKHLTELGINTPMLDDTVNGVDDSDKIENISEHVHAILETLGLDLTDDSLEETPIRVGKMFVNEIFSGLKDSEFPKCTTVENKFCNGEEFVMEKNISLYSSCEHHLLTIEGVAHVAYIPKERVLGLSKLNRIVQYFSRRPQVQERLTQQIAHAIAYIVDSQDVIVAIDAKHLCVAQRGVRDTSSSTITMCALGQFGQHDSVIRREFQSNI